MSDLDRVIKQLMTERNSLNEVIRALESLGSRASRNGLPMKRTIKRTMSAAGRARIVAAQRARWAKFRAKAKKAA